MTTRVAFDMRLSDASLSRLAAPSRKLPQGLAERPLNIIMEFLRRQNAPLTGIRRRNSLAQR